MKKIAFKAHGSAYKMNKLYSLSDKLERKFSELIFIKTRNTTLGKDIVRIGEFNKEQFTLVVILPHKYSKKNNQVKIIIGLPKTLSEQKIEDLINNLDVWFKKNV